MNYLCIPIIIIDPSVRNAEEVTCFSNCDSDVIDADNPSDASVDDFNECCNTVSTTSGYGFPGNCFVACKFCYNYYNSLHILAIYLCD